MLIIDVSGLASGEGNMKSLIRKDIQWYFACKLGISEDATKVTFIADYTIGKDEHVVARMYSQSFMKMEVAELDNICDAIVSILETAGHPFAEAFPIPILTMRGRHLNKTSQQ